MAAYYRPGDDLYTDELPQHRPSCLVALHIPDRTLTTIRGLVLSLATEPQATAI